MRHAALHACAEAFPLGLGVLTAKGVTAWRRALASLAPDTPPARPAPAPPASAQAAAQPALPPGLAAELISILAAVALAAAGPSP